MTDPVDLALTGFQTVISNLAPSGLPALNAAYVYPRESESWRQQFSQEQLPVGIISQIIEDTNVWNAIGSGQYMHKWQILFRLMLRRGKINDSELAHEVAQIHNGYIRSTAVLLAGNATLGGSITLIGEGRGGNLMYSSIGHVSWLKTDYWGVLIAVPIQQILETPTQA